MLMLGLPSPEYKQPGSKEEGGGLRPIRSCCFFSNVYFIMTNYFPF